MSINAHAKALHDLACDIITTAVEGGIQYWATVRVYHWTDPDLGRGETKSATVTLFETDEETDEVSATRYVVDAPHMSDILRKVLSGEAHEWHTSGYEETFHARLLSAWRELGNGAENFIDTDLDYDAIDADNLLQLACFGEVVYG